MTELRIGACSWKYDSWEGLVYSRPQPPNYLQEYAQYFNTVEIDQWFWSLFGMDKIRLPSPGQAEEYLRSVPPEFRFTVKAPNSLTLTHFYQKNKTLPLEPNPYFLSVSLFRDFLAKIDPLLPRVGAILLQFEYLNKKKMPSLSIFLEKLRRFNAEAKSPVPLCVEIRNPHFLRNEFFRFLLDNSLGHVFLQGYFMPPVTAIYEKFRNLMPNIVVIRLHGPGRAEIEIKTGKKWNKIVESKDGELPAIAGMIRDLQRREVDIYVNVNNHYEGSAPLTIRKLSALLAK